jgi:uncharacterized protein
VKRSEVMKALIVDGQNGHDIWPKTTAMMKSYLEETGLFTVDVARTGYTWQGDPYDEDGGVTRGRRRRLLETYAVRGERPVRAVDHPVPDPDFEPDFSAYDVVVSNLGWRASNWPRKTELALERFVAEGGGFLPVHAANNAFPHWVEYNRMCGIGGWGDRDEKCGPRLYYTSEGVLVRDHSPGAAGSHGHEQEFRVTLRDQSHPVTRGMPRSWMHAKDELYERLRGPAEDVTVLATAFSDVEKNACYWAPVKGSNQHEPMVLCREYGNGRVFHTVLGHFDYSIECVGFIVFLQRGAEWAATGNVTQPLPADFPTAEKVRVRAWQS